MKNDLEDLRKRIDNIDDALVGLLAERFRVTREVGLYKKAHGLSAVDEAREAAQFARIEKLALEAGLDPEFANKILRFIINETVKNHKKIN